MNEEQEKARAKILAAMDQAASHMADSFPPMLHGFYVALVAQGFSEEQSMELTQSLMFKMLDLSRG